MRKPATPGASLTPNKDRTDYNSTYLYVDLNPSSWWLRFYKRESPLSVPNGWGTSTRTMKKRVKVSRVANYTIPQ